MTFFVTNDGVKLNYHSYGQAENPAILLINGYSASEITWFRQIEDFAAAGFYVVTYDHRGHGQSQKVLYGLTLARLATDLQQLITHLALTDVILLGHSMGAATIMAYEELFTDQNLRAVITEDQAPTFLRSPNWLDGKTGKEFSELEQFALDFPHTKLTQKPLDEAVKRALGQGMYPFDFKAYQPLLRNVITQDWRANLTRETKPHLFLAGGQSPIFPAEHAVAARQLQPNPHSQALIFEGCGHLLHLEATEQFNQTVITFLHDLDKTKKD